MAKILMSFSSPDSSKVRTSNCRLLQDNPLQPPHAGTHLRPVMRHVHSMIPQALWDVLLHFYLITFSQLSGAAGRSHLIGSKTL